MKVKRDERLRQIEAVLQGRAMNTDQIMAEVGLCRDVVCKYVRDLRDLRRIYVCDYEPRGMTRANVFTAGDKDDAPIPQLEYADEEPKRPMTVVNVRRDPLDVALFGEYRRAA